MLLSVPPQTDHRSRIVDESVNWSELGPDSNSFHSAGGCVGTWMTSDHMKVGKGLGLPVVALPGVGHMPAKGEDGQEARGVLCGGDQGGSAVCYRGWRQCEIRGKVMKSAESDVVIKDPGIPYST